MKIWKLRNGIIYRHLFAKAMQGNPYIIIMSFGLASVTYSTYSYLAMTTKMIYQLLISTCTFKENMFWRKIKKKNSFVSVIFKSFVVPDNTSKGNSTEAMVLYMYIQLRNRLIYCYHHENARCRYTSSPNVILMLHYMVWYRPQKRVISRATNTEKRCILSYILIPYLILLAYNGLSYEKVTTSTSLISHLHDSYISGTK